MRSQHGFSATELLAVVVIAGLVDEVGIRALSALSTRAEPPSKSVKTRCCNKPETRAEARG